MIEVGKHVGIEYTLTLDDGTKVDTNVGQEPLVYRHGDEQILPALESALAGMKVDDATKVTLTAEEGYGVTDPEAFRKVGLDSVPDELREVGNQLAVSDQDGNTIPVTVSEVGEDGIVLDFNHPLAGEALHFEVKILSVE